MVTAFINDYHKTGVILVSGVNMKVARERRELAGDLVFNEDGSINVSDEWLWDWEKTYPECYARRQQRSGLKVKFNSFAVPGEK